jgi:hypothetical protein
VRRQADLVITAAAAILACVSTMFTLPVAVTAVLGIALLAAPGYLFGHVLFGSRVDGLERLAVLTGLALCVPILGGLLLAVIGVPLNRAAWLGLLAGATLLGDLLLVLCRRGSRAAAAGRTGELGRPRTRHAAAFAIAVMITVGALGLARAGAAIQHNPGFTQLWLVRPGQNAATVTVGVGNREGTTIRYRLVLLRRGRPIARWDLTLANDQTWHQSPSFSRHYTITANLYRLPDLSRPYRHAAIDRGGVPSS